MSLGLGGGPRVDEDPPDYKLVELPIPGTPGLPGVRELRFTWNYDTADYQTCLPVRIGEYDSARSQPRVLDHTAWAREYVADGSLPEIRQLAATLARLGPGFGTYAEVSFVLAFVQQSITYQHDDGEYPKYPIETLVDACGDCEDFAIFAASLLQAMDYQVALLFVPGHCALGVAGASGVPGVFATNGDNHYYYCEMTAKHWKIGELPDDYEAADIQVSPVPQPPRRVVDSSPC